MKRIIAAVLTLALAVSMTAFAMELEGEDTDIRALLSIQLEAEHPDPDAEKTTMIPIDEETKDAEQVIELYAIENDELVRVATVSAYYDEQTVNTEEKDINLEDWLRQRNFQEVALTDMSPVSINNYKPEYGAMSAKLFISKNYNITSNRCVVMMGKIDPDSAQSGMEVIRWTAHDATCFMNTAMDCWQVDTIFSMETLMQQESGVCMIEVLVDVGAVEKEEEEKTEEEEEPVIHEVETVRSPGMEDLYKITTKTAHSEEGSDSGEGGGGVRRIVIVLYSVNVLADEKDEEETEEEKRGRESEEKLLKTSKVELKRLMEVSAKPDDYFGSLRDQDRQPSTMTQAAARLGITNPIIDEFFAINAFGFDSISGDKVKSTMRLPTSYEDGESVLFMIGIVTPHGEVGDPGYTQTVEWFAFDAVGYAAQEGDEEGRVTVEIDLDIVLRVQNEMAVVALISNGDAE